MKYVFVVLCIVQLALSLKPTSHGEVKVPKGFEQHARTMEQGKPGQVQKMFDMEHFGYNSDNREYNVKLGTMIQSASQALRDLCGQFEIHHKNPCHLRNSAECQCHRAGFKIQLPKDLDQAKINALVKIAKKHTR